MHVVITRDCQVNNIFYSKGNEVHVDKHLFNPDCMEEVKPSDEAPIHEANASDSPPQTSKKKK